MMNILFLNAYFAPETIAYTHLEKDLLDGLVETNNQIQVICPIPTRGINKRIREDYKNKKQEKLYGGTVTVRRFWAPQEKKNPIIRAFRYFWCNFRSYQLAVKLKNIDVIFSNSTPPTQGTLSAMVAKKLSKRYKRKVSFVYNLQDIFPDSMVNTGLTHRKSFLWEIGRRVEDYTYRSADKIIVISEGFENNIKAKGVPESKIKVISNWIDLDSVHSISRDENKLVDEFLIDTSKFLVVYAGNFGTSQGADIILKAAGKLKNEADIQFVIFGGGTYFEEAKKESEKLDNVFIHELMPSDRISEVYSLGDIALITCKAGTENSGLPSKTWSIMACNTPIIASFDTDSELSMIIQEAGAGICVAPEQEDELADAIKAYYEKWNKGLMPTVNSREYVLNHASKAVCVQKYIEVFENMTEKSLQTV
jgi:glycosyltransferase involved in cell wall biosynthesis